MTAPKPPNAGKGRKKGTPNRVTVTIREAALVAFNRLGAEQWLLKMAKRHPVEFLRFLGRLIPREVTVTGSSTAPPPPSLTDPQVLAAALALDEVVDARSHAPGARPVDASDLPLGSLPALDSAPSSSAHDPSANVAERQALQAPDDPDAAAAR